MTDLLILPLTLALTLRKKTLAAINGTKFLGLRNLKCDFENVHRWFIDSAPDVACSKHEI